jgi:hypothetical protein
MGLIGRFKIGFAMARRSGRVLRSYPRLLAFPLLGGLSGAAFIATLLGGLYVMGPLLQGPGPAMYATLFVAYLLETFVASFFTAALVAATRTVFNGDEPSIGGRSLMLGSGNYRCWPGRSLPPSSVFSFE